MVPSDLVDDKERWLVESKGTERLNNFDEDFEYACELKEH